MRISLIIITLAICLLISSSIQLVHCQQSIYYIEQIGIKTSEKNIVKTLYIPYNYTKFEFKICNIHGLVEIYLSNNSKFAIGNVEYITILGNKEDNIVLKKYNLRDVVLYVPDYVNCIKILLYKTDMNDNFGIVLSGLSRQYVLNNNILNISSTTFPNLAIINGKLGYLLYYKICIVSIAPINLTYRPKLFTEIVEKKYTGELYVECLKSYMHNIEISIEGTARVNVTAYYIIPVEKSNNTYKMRKVKVYISNDVLKICNNVQICNNTQCSSSIVSYEKSFIYLTIDNIAVRTYYLDSIISNSVKISNDIVPLSSVILTDLNGLPLSYKTISRSVKIILSGPITVTYRPDVCVVEGVYTAYLKFNNRTISLGKIYITRGVELKLPFVKMSVHINLGGICKSGCPLIVDVCGKNYRYYVYKFNNTFNIAYLQYCKSKFRIYTVVDGKRIELPYVYTQNGIVVNLCLSKIYVNTVDMFGLPINARVYIDGNLCRGGCVVLCGYHRVNIVHDEYSVSNNIYVNSSKFTITISIPTFSCGSIIIIMFVICVICLIVFGLLRIFKVHNEKLRVRKREDIEDEDVIEIR